MLPEIHEGMTEKQLAIRLDFLQLELGAQCNSFDTICASGENGSLPHAIPGERKVRKGDLITFDFGCKVGGYCSDMTRTVALGEPLGGNAPGFTIRSWRPSAWAARRLPPGKELLRN